MKYIPIRQISNADVAVAHARRFQIRKLDDQLAENDLKQELHRHDFYFLLALKKGKGKHTIDFNNYTIRDHSLFLMRPGQVHELHLKAGSQGYLLEFHPGFYHPANSGALQHLRKASQENCYRPGAKAYDLIENLFESVFNELQHPEKGYQSLIRAHLDILFIRLLRLKESRKPKVTNPYMQEQLDNFRELLETHATEHLGPSAYAQRMHLSLYQLNAITRNTLGKTSSAIIDEHLLLEARRLLLATNVQVNQVAEKLGFQDTSYFIRFFRKHLGCTPSEYRVKFA